MLSAKATTSFDGVQALSIDKSVFLRKFTENALKQAKEGSPEEYYKLVKIFSYSKHASPVAADKYAEEVMPWISALSENVSSLSITYRELVSTIFYSDWIPNPDERFVHRYATLVIQILSAHPVWVPDAMAALVRWFTFGGQSGEAAAAPLVHDRLHALIKEIYRTIPTCGTSLAAAIVEACPFRTVKTNKQVVFLQNTLRCLEYALGVRRDVLRVVLSRVIQVDVEVQVELEDLESDDEEGEDEDEESGGEDEEGVFQFEMDKEDDRADASDSESESGSESGSDSDSESDLSDGDDLGKVKHNAKRTATKLDAMMNTIFAWLEKHCVIDLELGTMPESTSQLFLLFLDLFDTIILPTFKSRYTQFFIFYLSAKDPQYADVFLGTMMGKVGDPVRDAATDTVSNVSKVAAASYLGSFVARANFLSPQIVRNVIGVLVQWANAYLDWHEQQVKNEEEARKARSALFGAKSYAQALGSKLGVGRQLGALSAASDFERHAVFYAVTQAVLYAFCFRWRDLAEAVGGGPLVETELDSLRWCHEVEGIQRIVFSKLNPLRACASAVAQQFASVASQTNFMFCYAVLQQNKRSTTNQDGEGSESSGAVSPELVLRRELDTFFPFDPLTLPISRQYIDGIYLEWKGIGQDDDDESDEEGSESDDGEDEDEEGVVEQMVAMSISPVPPIALFPGQGGYTKM
ncbi:RNA polymerase I-specific transcription initiation factor RRN3 [Martensiomyces pterosporus]|nr:RNA polymerase I-specific transcription initiation factor RRN3 [Martensiomyces pterosporus]